MSSDLQKEHDSDESGNDIDMSVFSENPLFKPKSRNQNEEFQYEVLTIDEICKQMQECIEQVKGLVELPSATIRTLLKFFKWDTQKLMEQLLDGNQEKLFNEVGIVVPSVANGVEFRGVKRPRRDENCDITECKICFGFVPNDDMISLECKHIFCKKCWDMYLTTKIIGQGQVNTITCPAIKCNVIVDDDRVQSIVTQPHVRSQYQRLVTNSFVESNRLLRWCPKPDCLHAFKVSYPDACPVKCVCGTEICFSCGESNHEPVECELLKAWNLKSSGATSDKIDGQTAKWIVSNTKECPKCHTSIEKNGGCNHITCKSRSCKYEFCWICLGSWSTHGSSYYACNKFDKDKNKKSKNGKSTKKSDVREKLERYLFYWNRYMNHSESLKFESKLYDSVNMKMEQLQEKYKMSWIEVQFLKIAVDILCKCRQTLMYTYIFAYYCESVPQAVIFEENQRDLQNSVEKLSQFLEQDIAKEVVSKIQPKVQDLYRYCEQRRKVLIQHIIEGHEKDWVRYDFDNEN